MHKGKDRSLRMECTGHAKIFGDFYFFCLSKATEVYSNKYRIVNG